MNITLKQLKTLQTVVEHHSYTEAAKALFMTRPAVSMQMNAQGAKTWRRLTAANIQRRIAIVLDGYVYSAPTVIFRIGGGYVWRTHGSACDPAPVLNGAHVRLDTERAPQRWLPPSPTLAPCLVRLGSCVGSRVALDLRIAQCVSAIDPGEHGAFFPPARRRG